MSQTNPPPPPPVTLKKKRAPLDVALTLAITSMALAFLLVVCGLVYSAGILPNSFFDPDGVIISFVVLALLLGMLPMAVLLHAIRRPIRAMRSTLDRRFDELLKELSDAREESALSDDARRVLNRARERELLRRAIQEDIDAGEWDAGIVLANELADRFGYRSDAEEFRTKIERVRSDTLKRQVDTAISLLDGLIVQRRWEAAMLEAGRIERLYPEAPRAQGLKERVSKARGHYREDLERRFLQAARDDDIDQAMSLLKELDSYLTPAEAEQFTEVARGVIGKARHNLGAQFKLAVQDRNWTDAAYYGRKILEEFPNSRMAAEVRPAIDGIRERASQHSGATER